MSPAARREVEHLFASDAVGDDDIAAVVRIVAENGGFEYARERGEEFAERAHEALSGLPETVARRSLSASISYVMERHS
jgi:geranylgeranyl pyrophosphate synthase